MARFFKKREKNKGLAPGSLIFIGDQKVDEIRIRVIDYNQNRLDESELKDIRGGKAYKERNTVTWINVDGLHNLNLIKDIGGAFDIHPLILEDILNTGQRPKLEEFDEYIYIVLKMLRYSEQQKVVQAEQLSLVCGKTFLLTFQEQSGDVFEPIRERIRKQKGKIRASGSDYLAYALLDTVVDNYIYIIERIGEKVEDIEEEILDKPEPELLERLNDLKREMNYIRKSVRPAKEFMLQLPKLDSDLIHESTIPFLKDLQDLISQTTDAIDTYRDMLSDQLTIYHTSISNKMNEIMKVLTIFAAIFIPLTFIAGIYGTNFEYFPELTYRYSYFIFWGIMVTIALVMLGFFKKRGWF